MTGRGRWHQLPITARLYIVGVLSASSLALTYYFPSLLDARLSQFVLALAIAASMIVASVYRIPLADGKAITVTVGISFAAILLLGTGLASWTTAVALTTASVYLSLHRKRWAWYTGAFNAGAYTLATIGSALVYDVLSRSDGGLLLSAQNTVALASAGTTYFIINTGLVAGITALHRRQDPWYLWISGVEKTAPEYFTLILLAILTAVIYNYRWWATLLIIPPFLVVYHSLRTSHELRVQTIEAVKALADTMDARDPYTFEHSRRIVEYAEGTARELGLPADEIEIIKLSARVHDLGKIGIQDAVLNKEGTYTREERLAMQQHVRIGAEIVGRFPRYKEGRDIILYHHEHYNGSGYLEGLQGDEIPIGSRIIAVADAYDAMTTDRPYRKALSQAEAIEELKRCSGTQFDPIVVGAFLKYLDKTEEAERRPSEPQAKPAPSHT